MSMEFQCQGCGACCRIKDGIVRVGDDEIRRIAAFFGMSEQNFIENETEVAPDRRGLILKSRPDDSCVYLTEDNRCRIHPVKPDKCRTFPFEWTNPDSAEVCPALKANGVRILFLCHGNICRSPMAEFVMKDLVRKAGLVGVTVESAALHTDEIGNDIHSGTRAKLREKGVPFAPRKAWLLNAAKAREYDLLIGMDAYNIADLRRLVYPEDLSKIHKLPEFAGKTSDIADPWYTGNFDATYDDVVEGCTALLSAIRCK